MKLKSITISVEIGRVVVPFLIFWNPFVAMVLSLFLDAIDATLFNKAGYSWKIYNFVDKVMDYWWYIFIFIYAFKLTVFPIILVLFLYRSIGQILSLLKESEDYYIWFPNILERFFNFYVLLTVLGVSVEFSWNPVLLLLLFISTLHALFTEWLIHIKKFSFTAKYLFNTDLRWDKKKK